MKCISLLLTLEKKLLSPALPWGCDVYPLRGIIIWFTVKILTRSVTFSPVLSHSYHYHGIVLRMTVMFQHVNLFQVDDDSLKSAFCIYRSGQKGVLSGIEQFLINWQQSNIPQVSQQPSTYTSRITCRCWFREYKFTPHSYSFPCQTLLCISFKLYSILSNILWCCNFQKRECIWFILILFVDSLYSHILNIKNISVLMAISLKAT